MSSCDEMKSVIQQLANQALRTFSHISKGSEPHNLDHLLRLVNLITAKDLNFDPKWVEKTTKFDPFEGLAPVTYVHIHENEYFSLGIFVLRNGYTLPLHDHPGMYGICKVIHGKIAVTSYSPSGEQKPVPASLTSQRPMLRPMISDRAREVTCNDCCCLSPTSGNIHEIQAVDGPAAFLDILAPPYDNKRDRNCHYYHKVAETDGITWLQLVPAPRDYWCYQGQYTGPRIEL